MLIFFPSFDGDINITFDTGLSIIIPNNQLVTLEPSLHSDGTITTNESTRVVLMSEGARDRITSLGKPLLSAAYLMVTQDTEPPALTMWKSSNNATNDFAAVDGDGNICTSSGFIGSVVQNPKDPDTTSSSVSNASASSNPNAPSQNGHILSAGATAGIAVGAVVAVLLIGGAIFYILRNRRRRRNALAARDRSSNAGAELKHGWSKAELPGHDGVRINGAVSNGQAELPGGQLEPRELQSDSYPRYELD